MLDHCRLRKFIAGMLIVATGCTNSSMHGQSFQSAAAADCFSTTQIAGYQFVTNRSIRIDAGWANSYEISFLSGGSCDRLNGRQQVPLRVSRTTSLCVGPQLHGEAIEFRTPEEGGETSCQIEAVQRLP
jgi:hypothetical protein